jgi:DNA mismatch repair protein MutS2
MEVHYHFAPGDLVQLLHAEQVGELMSIHQGKATIRFEYITVTVPLQEIQPAVNQAWKQAYPKPSGASKNLPLLDLNQFANFNPELDLHGLSIQEAIKVLDKWIDQGLLAGHRHLRIIHGKGKGLLRQQVHQYLKTNEMIRKVIDQHQFPGGSGVTYIEL